MKAISRIFWVLIGGALVAAILAPAAMYLYGLRSVPEDRAPLASDNIPDSTIKSYWRFLGGSGDVVIAKRNPYSYLVDMYRVFSAYESDSQPSADFQLISRAARSVMFRHPRNTRMRDWHLGNASAAIWISRHWPAREVAGTILTDDFFGHGFFGIESAALGYFGKPSADLSDVQLVHLFVTTRAPSRMNLWCDLERNTEISRTILDRLGYAESDIADSVLPAPPGSCDR